MLPSLLAMHACRYLKGSLWPVAKSATSVSQVLHSINAHQLDLIHSMDGYLDKTVVPILKDVKTMWQPTDFLPDSSSPDFLDQVRSSPGVPLLYLQRPFARHSLVDRKQK